MNHNQFDYENDLIYPLKDFLRRHTGFKTTDLSDIEIPSMFFEVPSSVKEMINNYKFKENQKGMSSCFCGDAERNIIREAEK
jgi:predicted RNA-binding protein